MAVLCAGWNICVLLAESPLLTALKTGTVMACAGACLVITPCGLAISFDLLTCSAFTLLFTSLAIGAAVVHDCADEGTLVDEMPFCSTCSAPCPGLAVKVGCS